MVKFRFQVADLVVRNILFIFVNEKRVTILVAQ